MNSNVFARTLSGWANAWLPPLLWAALIYLLSAQSSLPGFDTAFFDFAFKKCAHMFVYGVLYLLTFRAFTLTQKPAAKIELPTWIMAACFCLAYASLDELHQYFTPYRHPAVRDIGYDMLGVFIAFLWKYRYI